MTRARPDDSPRTDPQPAEHSEANGRAATVPIADASRLLGIPMPTLRSWELRYDIPGNTRDAGTHRRYTEPQLRALRMMRDEIARGNRAGEAAQSVRAVLGQSGPVADHIAGLLTASQQRDPAAVRDHLDQAVQSLGLGASLDQVLMPAMRQIGVWWQTGRCDIEQESLTTETVRAWLDNLTATAPQPRPGNPVLLACGPADVHSVGLESLAVLLRHQRVPCRLLGARTPIVRLLTALEARGAPAVIVVSHLSIGRQRAIEAIRAVQQTGTPVFYAGNAFTSTRSRRNLAGRYLGVELSRACTMVVEALAATEPGPASVD
jgi:DNA-binding transcriptional MerR regulator